MGNNLLRENNFLNENFAKNDCTHLWGADGNTYITPLLSVSKFKTKTTDKLTAQCELLSFGSEVENLYMLLHGRKKIHFLPPPPPPPK